MGKIIILILFGSLLAVVQSACFNASRSGGLLYPHMAGNGDTEFLPRELDARRRLEIRGKYKFYGQRYTGEVWVVTHGLLALTNETSIISRYEPIDFMLNGTAFIAPAYSDIDIEDAPTESHIWYRETNSRKDRKHFNKDIRSWFCKAGESFSAKHLIIVTFQKVENYCDHYDYIYYGYYRKRDVPDSNQNADINREKRVILPSNMFPQNTFQIVYATDNKGKSFVMFNYHSLCWFECATYTRAGFNNGEGKQYEILNSGTSDFGQNDDLSNVDKPGRFVYRVDGNVLRGPDCKKLQ